jgi:hypothetical protein
MRAGMAQSPGCLLAPSLAALASRRDSNVTRRGRRSRPTVLCRGFPSGAKFEQAAPPESGAPANFGLMPSLDLNSVSEGFASRPSACPALASALPVSVQLLRARCWNTWCTARDAPNACREGWFCTDGDVTRQFSAGAASGLPRWTPLNNCPPVRRSCYGSAGFLQPSSVPPSRLRIDRRATFRDCPIGIATARVSLTLRRRYS